MTHVGLNAVKVYSNRGTFNTGEPSEGTILLYNNELYYYPPSTVTTVAEFKAWLANNDLVVSYPLANPDTAEVEAFDVRMGAGENSFTTNDGITTVQYRADIQKYIEKNACTCN